MTTIDVQYDDKGEAFIQIPDDMAKAAGFEVGDTVVWTDNKDGSFTLTKKETEWVLVDAVQTFKVQYMVEVPRGKKDWALDTVTMEEAKEFSQEFIGEQIFSHRVVKLDEALAICDQVNDYAASWTQEKKLETFFTSENEPSQESDPEDIVVWPDDTWCYRHDLPTMNHMSDDYEVISISTTEAQDFLKREGV